MLTLDPRFIESFVKGARETFKIQYGLTITPSTPFIQSNQPQSDIAIAAVIGIMSETFKGTIAICFPEKVFLGTMSKMLGEEFKEISFELRDGAAEILNIIFGQAKIVLNEQGYGLQKAIPTVITGQHLLARSESKFCVTVLPFSTDIGDFHIEICSAPAT